ncbi:zinc-dependent alcohol dehydrogenase family protein [Paenarthrobacter sp. JL.01a]|uniref:zinc-dependent alcohol dehydrogenase family protein n=1 Tax=Paenarthrobacter sp. JL.01a TaxID=2979324 RepID=UPI0021C9CB27|nr:zinc-dependent alcohol dehydrogenase family protein [Paenarthrobacter sp. JL.01a]UXM91829.1 zinc-dependent alcohol dehydrogenase family protein [Paenarthrobacter sp. JL.01a]
MYAALLRVPGPIENHPLEYSEVPEPVPGPGEVAISVLECGVCRSNLHMIEGEWLPGTPAALPIIPGHEVIGRVKALGPGVSNLAVGDRIGVQPIWSTCGSCEHCFGGHEQRCRRRQITGETRDGGYAEVMLAKANFACKIPDSLSDTEAAPLLCPGITAYGALKKARLRPGRNVAVFGIGGVGHLALQMAAITGARVNAVSRRPKARALAEELGAHGSYVPSGSEGGLVLRDGSQDAAIVFAPSDQAVAEALRVIKPGGRVILGVSQSVGGMDIGDEKTIVGTVLGTRQDMADVLDLAVDGKLHAVHEDFPLSEANLVLQRLKNGQLQGRAVLVPGA